MHASSREALTHSRERLAERVGTADGQGRLSLADELFRVEPAGDQADDEDGPVTVEVGDGRDTSFAVTAAGEVWAWGDNGAGQLGDGTTVQRRSPVRLPGVSGVAVVQGGALHTLFLPG